MERENNYHLNQLDGQTPHERGRWIKVLVIASALALLVKTSLEHSLPNQDSAAKSAEFPIRLEALRNQEKELRDSLSAGGGVGLEGVSKRRTLASVLRQQNEFKEAIDVLKEALAKQESWERQLRLRPGMEPAEAAKMAALPGVVPDQAAARVAILLELADVEREAGRLKEAETTAMRILSLDQAYCKYPSKELARDYDNLGVISYLEGLTETDRLERESEFIKARGYFARALDAGGRQTTDLARDQMRHQTTDQTRDPTRDQTRDLARDQTRDSARDQAKDQTRDPAKQQTRQQSGDPRRTACVLRMDALAARDLGQEREADGLNKTANRLLGRDENDRLHSNSP